MSLEENLTNILKHYFDHDVVYVSHERRAEAKQAILEAVREIVPCQLQRAQGDYKDGYEDCRKDMLYNLGVTS